MKKLLLTIFILIIAVAVFAGCDDTTTKPTKLSIENSTQYMLVGETFELTPKVEPATILNKLLTWETSDATIVSVENGKLTALTKGEVSISASIGDLKASVSVVVGTKRADKTTTIQTVINEAVEDDVIIVTAGEYDEQLLVNNKNISLIATSGVTINGPENYADIVTIVKSGEETHNVSGIVSVNNSTLVIKNFTIKGVPARATLASIVASADKYCGIAIANSNISIVDCTVLDIKFNDNLSGAQNGYSVFAVAGTETKTITATNSTFKNFNKCAFYINSGYKQLTITNCLIEGNGAQNIIAQNGIVYKCKATIKNNTIKNVQYIDETETLDPTYSVGIIEYGAPADTSIIENNVYENVDAEFEKI